MDNCCIFPPNAQNWIPWIQAMPMSPFDIIQNAAIGSAPGVLVNSTNYNNSTWGANTVGIKSGMSPQVSALETTNAQMVANAAQWNFAAQTNNASATLAPPLLRAVFMRGGIQWAMSLPLDFSSTTYTNLQLSLLDNAGTRGDAQGTVPVIEWTGSFTGTTVLTLTFKAFGTYIFGLRCDTGSAVSMYESRCIIVP
jgi:hypothetical protein